MRLLLNMNQEYVDHNLTTKRDWKIARKMHRKKLVEIVRTPSRRLSSTPQNVFPDSRSRQRSQGIYYTVTGKIEKENLCLRSRITNIPPAVNVSNILDEHQGSIFYS